MSLSNSFASPVATKVTDEKGRYRFTRQRSDAQYYIDVEMPGYAGGYQAPFTARSSATKEITLPPTLLHRSDSFVAGRVVSADGTPAVGLQVSASGAPTAAKTDSDGRFHIAQTPSGPILLSVSRMDGSAAWPMVRETAGRSDVVVKLPRMQKPATLGSQDLERAKQRQAALVGQFAPDITATAWVNSPPLSLRQLRGKIVLLDFFAPYSLQPDIGEIAEQFAERGVRVIGIHISPMRAPARAGLPPVSRQWTAATLRALARDHSLSYPLALDVPRKEAPTGTSMTHSSLLGATGTRYADATRVVIDRSGRIVYAGHSLGEAMQAMRGLLVNP